MLFQGLTPIPAYSLSKLRFTPQVIVTLVIALLVAQTIPATQGQRHRLDMRAASSQRGDSTDTWFLFPECGEYDLGRNSQAGLAPPLQIGLGNDLSLEIPGRRQCFRRAAVFEQNTKLHKSRGPRK